MNLIELSAKYNTHLKCVKHLEKVRWNNKPVCPKCSKPTTITSRKGFKTPRYHCNGCNKDFTVLSDTIFEGSKLTLNKWFLLIALMLNARKGISSLQLSRDLKVTYKTAWYSAMRVRCAMIDNTDMLEGIVEMDEVYIGGKPRKRNVNDNVPDIGNLSFEKPKRGRGTSKTAVVGIVERTGKKRVVTQVKDSLTGRELLAMLKKYVKTDEATLMTDDFRGYKALDKEIERYSVNHSKKEYARGNVHTNTIEGFWSIIKNGIRGQYHVLSKKYLPFYLAEFTYKYNHRLDKSTNFDDTISNTVCDDKCVVNYKPKKDVRKIAYRKKPKCK